MAAKREYRIAVVGCGSTGLAAAAFLHDAGQHVTLFERFEAPEPLGAGLLLQPTGLSVLARLGLDRKAINRGCRIHHLYGQAVAGGPVIFDLDYRDLAPHWFGLGIHRGSLFALLYDAVRARGIELRTACAMQRSGIENGKRWLEDACGERFAGFDLVVDASGSRSALRDRHAKIRFNRPYPYGAVWAICEDPDQRLGGDALQQRYDGAGVMIGVMSVGRSPQKDSPNYATLFWSLRGDAYAAWRDAGMASWRRRVSDYWPEIAPLVEQLTDAEQLTRAAYSDVMLERCHEERLVFLGDAAHCMSPQLGQGANLGLVDAMILSDSLSTSGDVEAGLFAYAAARRPHVRFYQTASRWMTPFFQSDRAWAAWLRDRSFGTMCRTPYLRTEMLRTLSGLKASLLGHLNPGDWHADYDVRSAASKADIA